MRARPHAHPCRNCKTPVECCGEIVQNWDGFPEFICREYHNEHTGGIEVVLCESCFEAEEKQAAAELAEQEREEATWK